MVGDRPGLDSLRAGGLRFRPANRAIAVRLGLSPKTIMNYVSNVFTKLHVADRAEMIVRARESGFGRGTTDQK